VRAITHLAACLVVSPLFRVSPWQMDPAWEGVGPVNPGVPMAVGDTGSGGEAFLYPGGSGVCDTGMGLEAFARSVPAYLSEAGVVSDMYFINRGPGDVSHLISDDSDFGSDTDDSDLEGEEEGEGGYGEVHYPPREVGPLMLPEHGVDVQGGYSSSGSRQRHRRQQFVLEGQGARGRGLRGEEAWVECFDDRTGRPYYFSQETGHTTWDRPYQALIDGGFLDEDDAHNKRE
jgi:hypothetical protein